MSRVPLTVPVLDAAAPTAGGRLSTSRDRVHAVAREFGPLAVALAGGVLLGVAVRGAFPAGAAAADLAFVVLLAGMAGAAILPTNPAVAPSGAAARAQPLEGIFSRVLASQRVFVLAACALAGVLAFTRGLDARVAWAPLVLCLQTALAAGLGLLAAAFARTRLGRFVPARVLVPAWLLATPGAWLVHAPPADAAPAWNPLHHLVAAWRAILLPGVGGAEAIGSALPVLAPAALLCALAGFAAFAASEPDEDASRA